MTAFVILFVHLICGVSRKSCTSLTFLRALQQDEFLLQKRCSHTGADIVTRSRSISIQLASQLDKIDSKCRVSSSSSSKKLSRSSSSNTRTGSDVTGDVGKEVYYGMFEKTLKAIKLFSLTNSAVVLIATPVMCYSFSDKLMSHSYLSCFALSCTFMVGIVVPVFLHTMSKRYVTHLFYNSQTNLFTLQYYSLFMRKKFVTFSSDDVTLPMSVSYSTHLIKDRPYFIMKQFFYSDHMHAKMLGC